MNSFVSLLNRIFRFYYEGFTSMSWWGKRIWLILLIKLFVIFIILKLFFFPDFLKRNYRTDEQRSEHVLEQLIKPN
ncbi:MAG: DUF4492 domain-containing protein [Bacteroidales bacterium]|nr:DUF4492 domain-containing protein [Bacteroidales bacterium]